MSDSSTVLIIPLSVTHHHNVIEISYVHYSSLLFLPAPPVRKAVVDADSAVARQVLSALSLTTSHTASDSDADPAVSVGTVRVSVSAPEEGSAVFSGVTGSAESVQVPAVRWRGLSSLVA